jgi:hypothetical protein
MTMSKTALDENNSTPFRQHYFRFTRQVLPAKSETQPLAMENESDVASGAVSRLRMRLVFQLRWSGVIRSIQSYFGPPKARCDHVDNESIAADLLLLRSLTNRESLERAAQPLRTGAAVHQTYYIISQFTNLCNKFQNLQELGCRNGGDGRKYALNQHEDQVAAIPRRV